MRIPAGWRLDIVEETGSTSTDLVGLARAGSADRVALLARRQLRGRGRHSRSWLSMEGGLSFSLLVRPALDADALASVALVAGLALHDGLAGHVAAGRLLRLKWPNDVMLDGGKLGGVLVESAVDRGVVEWIVAGFGANLANAPLLAGRHTSDLADGREPPAAEAVAGDILRAWEDWMAILGNGFDAVRSGWLARAHPLGTRLAVDGVEGCFAGLSEAGHLRLRTRDGLRTVATGDVVLAERSAVGRDGH